MASTSGTAEHDGAQQVHKKPKRKCGSCASCCACYTQCMSGFIFLLIIAGLVLCVRFFLEFPFILNGFASANNLTEQLVASDIALSSMNSATQQYDLEAQSGRCQMFVGSFQLLNESYLSQYNVSSSTEFQAMDKRIQNMLNLTFNKSLLKATYRKSSVFSLRPDPFTAHFQLMFCNDTTTDSGTSAKTVLQVIISYNISLAQTDIYMNNQTVILGKEAPCPINVDLSSAWPWQAIILENQTAVCLGSLLTDSWVVSTAGCLKNRNISLLSVIMGNDSSLRSSTWKVSKVIQHPNFTTSANNIALVLLSLPVWFNSSIMPTCLPQTSQDPAMGIRCSATTGSILSAVSTIGLMNVSGTVTSASNCLFESQSGTIYISNTLSKTWINQVDLGNSLTCINTDGTVYLQGIFSYEQNSNTSSLCLKYTSIGSTVEWVKSYIIV